MGIFIILECFRILGVYLLNSIYKQAASQCFAFLGISGEFRSLRRATKGAALWNPATGSALSIPATFEKVDETFIPGYSLAGVLFPSVFILRRKPQSETEIFSI